MLIVGGNQSAGGYEVDNSLRFDRGSSDYLDKTFSGAGSRTTWTISAWVKRANELGTNSYIIDSGAGNGTALYFGPEQIEFWDYQSGAYTGRLTTNGVFRDMSAWYHIVAVWDTTNGTAGDRMRLYVNGVEETSFATDTNPSSSQNSILNDGSTSVTIGKSGPIYSNLYMSEICFIDGTALDPTSFGEFDEDTGIWKPISVSGLTFGTNGFYLDFENSGSLGADVSGNGNNFTVNNLTSVDQTTDTPTNNWCTLNSLDKSESLTPTEGNLAVSNGGGTWMPIKSTLGMSSGKWYCEAKITSGTDFPIGIYLSSTNGGNQSAMDNSRVAYNNTAESGKIFAQGVFSYSESSVGTSGTGDIIGMALDCDNGTMKFFKNGTQLGSTVTNSAISSNEWMFGVQLNGDGVQFNFGNPPFTISSGNSDANGYGNFEYAVPSGYYALNTKNLAEYG